MMAWLKLSTFLFVGTFMLFLAVMKLRDARDLGTLRGLNWTVIWLAYSLLFVGLIMDVLLNWIVLTALFLEPPREVLSTMRVKRLKNTTTGWRQRLAAWLCANFLTPFDNHHCGG